MGLRTTCAAAAGAGHRIAGLRRRAGAERVDCRVPPTATGAWVERGPQYHYRLSLGEGHSERFSEIAAEFVQRKVTLILTHNTPPTLAAKQATSTIPIVFATAGDPIGAGIVPSLARPGGNITGLSSQTPDAAGKRLELFQQVVPGLHRLATLADVDNPYATLDLRQFNEAARTLGIEVLSFEIRRSEELDSVFDALKRRTDALYVLPVPLLFANRTRINTLALSARLPTLYGVREYVEAGGLMSYGPNWPS